jgi:succinyl-diaminopimelate desuccinylase
MTDDINENLTEVITELVSRETENPPGNEATVAEFVESWLEERGINATLVREPYEDRPQVAARIGESDPTVVLNGHIDVVPAGDLNQWSHPPYDAERDGNDLYGRGSIDMKTGVALAMVAAADLRSELEGGDLDGSLVVHAAIGEETAEPGTNTLLEEGYDGDYGVVLEPTGMRTATSEKGLAWYEFTVGGDPSHASRPDQGTNAILRARPLLNALAEYDTEIREREDDLVGQAYATVTQFDAGTKENVLPETAVITIDRRFLPSESPEAIDEEITNLTDRVASEHDIDVSWERTRTYESAAIESESDLAKVFREHSATIAEIEPDPWGIQASTDVRNFINDGDIEAITWGPGDLSQAHTFDEHVDLVEATTGLDVLKASLRELMNGEQEDLD